jgi:lipoyl(octanoyl) transferase
MDERNLIYEDIELIDFNSAWKIQREKLNEVADGISPDTIFLLEHPHTYTFGKIADEKNLIATRDFISKYHIEIIPIDRGGDITYHGPGQLVGYPIINLNNWKKSSHNYIWSLEEVIIKTCIEYGLNADRNPEHRGVWIDDRKICAIGIKFARWVTMHGFAFNVNTDLDLFKGIIPCGIKDKEVTSLQKETGRYIDMTEVKKKVLNNFIKEFQYSVLLNLKDIEINDCGS